MATFLAVLKYVWPLMAGAIIAELWRQNRLLKRMVASQQKTITTITTPSGIVEIADTVTAEQAEEFKRRWLEAVNEPGAAYRIEVLHPCICPQINVTVPGGPLRYLPGKRNPNCRAHDERNQA